MKAGAWTGCNGENIRIFGKIVKTLQGDLISAIRYVNAATVACLRDSKAARHGKYQMNAGIKMAMDWAVKNQEPLPFTKAETDKLELSATRLSVLKEWTGDLSSFQATFADDNDWRKNIMPPRFAQQAATTGGYHPNLSTHQMRSSHRNTTPQLEIRG